MPDVADLLPEAVSDDVVDEEVECGVSADVEVRHADDDVADPAQHAVVRGDTPHLNKEYRAWLKGGPQVARKIVCSCLQEGNTTKLVHSKSHILGRAI